VSANELHEQDGASGRASVVEIDHDAAMGALPFPVADLVDADRYPLHLLAAGGCADLVERGSRAMRSDGLTLFDDFLRPTALADVVDEARRLSPLGHFSETFSSPYLSAPDPTRPPTDPRSHRQRAALSAVAFDEFPTDSPLRRLYESRDVAALVAAVLGVERLHRYADPLGALSLAVMRDGDELGWHFDFSEFVVSLCIQDPTGGGTFDVVPGIRGPDPATDTDVLRVLHGEHPGVRQLPLRPGTLVLFAGRNSLHRVPPIRGEVDRLVALLSYDTRPDTDSTDELKLIRYGRTGPRRVERVAEAERG
jgi:hypothetical protein